MGGSRKGRAPAADAPPASDLRGEAVLKAGDKSFTLVIDMNAVDRFEGSGDRSLIDVLTKFRHPGLFGSPKLSDLVDITRCAMLFHHADELPDREAVRQMVNSDGWNPAFRLAVTRAFPSEGEPEPAA